MTTTPAPSALLSVGQAAHAAGVSPFTIQGWITKGSLPAVWRGRQRFVRPGDLAAAQQRVHLGSVIPAWRADPARAGHRLRLLRESAGLSQLALAARSGLTHEAISILEHGRRSPYAQTVRQLAQALGVAPERFVDAAPIGLTMLSVAEAAARLDVPAGRVQKWLRHGHLPGTKVSGHWRTPAISVHALGHSGRMRGESRRLDPRYRG